MFKMNLTPSDNFCKEEKRDIISFILELFCYIFYSNIVDWGVDCKTFISGYQKGYRWQFNIFCLQSTELPLRLTQIKKVATFES
jgi:F0F1-type ATP synthase membrane subunit a